MILNTNKKKNRIIAAKGGTTSSIVQSGQEDEISLISNKYDYAN